MDLVPCLRAGSLYGSFCFSEDSKYLFCCYGTEVKVYSTSSGECVRELKGHQQKVTGVHLNPSNLLQVISCGQDGLLIYWDYLDGVKLKEHNLHLPLWGIVAVNADKKSIILVAQTSQHKKEFSLMRWKKLKPSYTDFDKPTTLIQQCSGDRRLVSFGCSKEVLASALGTKVTVYSVKKDAVCSTLKDKEKYNQAKAVTCVACHPSEYILACGYESGKIILWHNILQSPPVPSLRHWHALPVLCLDFSLDGSILLSGGHECVLVRWQTSHAHHRDFKPRMGAPLTHVLASPDGSFYASRHSDNVVQLVNINLKVTQVYRGLTRASLGMTSDSDPIPCGLTFDPRSRALVTNGLPGHLQFYSLALHRQLYNLDIVGQNYISPENLDRPKVVTRVTSCALSETGQWLATYQAWHDGYFSPEQHLKLWQWNPQGQTYCLNTTVESPHDSNVTSMLFRPGGCRGHSPALVTVGADKLFKLWVSVDDSDIYRTNSKWTCESVGEYRSLSACCADFSTDGSVLAVAFEHLLTLWDVDSNTVKAVLCSSLDQGEAIQTVQFGGQPSQHHLVAATKRRLLAWDLLSLSVLWSVPQDNVLLFKDPSSELMAFVDGSHRLGVFRPASPEVLFEHAPASDTPVLAAIFVPEGRGERLSGVGWPGSSQIYLYTQGEELLTFDTRHGQDGTTTTARIAQDLPSTALSALMAERVVRDSALQSDKLLGPGQPTVNPMILNSNEPVSVHCTQFLHNLLSKRKSSSSRASPRPSEDEASSDSDMETEESPAMVTSQPTGHAGSRSSKRESIKEKLLSPSHQQDWVKWCAALKLK